jgi:RecB family exonuclease
VKTEYSISATLGIDYITGTLDRLSRDADGLWTVLDYKTDAVTLTTVNARAEVYWPQLRFYAVMVGRLHRPPSIKMRILFASLPDLSLVKEISAAELLDAEKEIGIVIGRIKAGEFAPPQQPCRDCPFLPNGCKK